MIDFNDDAQMTHGLERIPIDSQAQYDALLVLAKAAYEKDDGPLWDKDMHQQTEQRVRNGMTVEEILRETRKDRGRKTNKPGISA
jgi:hypothetical protein